jgi:hypothetical protein
MVIRRTRAGKPFHHGTQEYRPHAGNSQTDSPSGSHVSVVDVLAGSRGQGHLGTVEAVALGLANKVLPRDGVLTAARAAAKALAQKPAGSVVSTKRLMRDVTAILARIDAESLILGERLKSDEAREALLALAERRPSDFSKFTS